MNPRFVGLVIVIGILGYVVFTPTSGSIISPVPDNPQVAQQPIFKKLFTPKKNPETLKQKIQETVANEWSNYSVYVADYTSTFTMGINETVMYDAASVNKIPIMAALYHTAQTGTVDFDQTITPQPGDVQDYGTGTIRYDPPGTAYSIKTLARLMMQKSDNTAAYVLANYVVGLDDIQDLVNSWGLIQTDMIKNTTSNRDMEVLMKKIMNGDIASPALTEEMLGFMKDSDFENRLPALLPEDAVVYHKIGSIDTSVHDVGVVTRGKTRYYIGVLTQGVTNAEAAEKLIAKVSRVVFDFLE